MDKACCWRLKCNVDAKTEWYSHVLYVDTGKALGLLSAMKWVKDLQLNVGFELDSKRVVDKR
jgi:hypothetical protein